MTVTLDWRECRVNAGGKLLRAFIADITDPLIWMEGCKTEAIVSLSNSSQAELYIPAILYTWTKDGRRASDVPEPERKERFVFCFFPNGELAYKIRLKEDGRASWIYQRPGDLAEIRRVDRLYQHNGYSREDFPRLRLVTDDFKIAKPDLAYLVDRMHFGEYEPEFDLVLR